jgi:hypothetical protein
LLFNNLTTGLFLFAAVGELASPDVLGPVAKVAYPVALVFLLTDLLMLVADLGDPLRFHHMLRVFKPSSPMSLGTWSLSVYSLPLTLIVIERRVLHLLPIESRARNGFASERSGLLPRLKSVAYRGALQHVLAAGLVDARLGVSWLIPHSCLGNAGCPVSVLTGDAGRRRSPHPSRCSPYSA